MAAIRARHEKFQQMYSPGRDWRPAENAHEDRGALLDHVKALEEELERRRTEAGDMRYRDRTAP